MRSLKKLAFLCILGLTLNSCIDNDENFEHQFYEDYDLMSRVLNISAEGPADYTLEFPDYYRRTGTFDKNDATLGRVMFYDKKLSEDGTISCASCHQQSLAFSDDKVVSDGIFGQVTNRNSLALGAVFNFQEYYGPSRVPFFWDNSVASVEEQVVTTFAAPNEMNMSMGQVVDVMNSNDYYKPLIRAANGTEEINISSATRALATFVNSLGSFNSKFDRALDTEYNSFSSGGGFISPQSLALNTFRDFTDPENRGKNIYQSNCASCHGEVMGAPNLLAANNGLEVTDGDFGVGNGEFKVPSLRNLTLTFPYMHDGRFATIEDVIEHYSTGIANTPALHPNLKNGGQAMQMNFTDTEKSELITFLKTFDDPGFLVNPIYSDPFVR